MRRKKISQILIFFLVAFSLLFIGTGMLLHNYQLIFENNSDHDVLLHIRYSNAEQDSVYLVKSGNMKLVSEIKSLQKQEQNQLREAFLNDIDKLFLFSEEGSGFVNLKESKDE
ncbi:MAG: hypothetical protein U9Q98_01290, partial [Bacteroidota bacterium]|nr:hypothetical protein [Bacteroidota bacterium]